MKTGVYSLLFAINLLYGSGVHPVSALLGGSVGSEPVTILPEVSTVPTINDFAPPTSMCLSQLFSNSSRLLLTTGLMVCQYDQGMGVTLNDDNLEDYFKILKNTLANTSCAVDDVLQIADTLRHHGTPTSEVVEKILGFLRPVLDNAGLSASHLNTLCNMTEPALTPSCVRALLAGDPVKLITDMKLQACQDQNERIFYIDLTAVLNSLECQLKDPVGPTTIPSVTVQDLKETSVGTTFSTTVSLPDIKESTSLSTVPPPVAASGPKKPAPGPGLLGARKRDLGGYNFLPNINASKKLSSPYSLSTDQERLFSKKQRKVIWIKKYLKLWIYFLIQEEHSRVLKQKMPKGPETTVTCTAVDQLVKIIAPV